MKQHYIDDKQVTVDLLNDPKTHIVISFDGINRRLVIHKQQKHSLDLYLGMNERKLKFYIRIKASLMIRSTFMIFTY